MERYDLNNVTPFTAIHVGEYIQDELSARGMKQSELAALSGVPAPILNNIIKGKRGITAEQSILIGRSLDIDDSLFYNLQTKYELDKARISLRAAEQQPAPVHRWSRVQQPVCYT